MNTSKVSNESTAKTCIDAALQRAQYLNILGAKNVLELCVGPSLKVLESFYKSYDMSVTGNDIEKRWQEYYPQGSWIIGDAFGFNYNEFDAVVFAPPLSIGCTGKREDSLSIDKVFPTYNSFINKIEKDNYKGIVVLVLPGRSLATKYDRTEYYKLLRSINKSYETIPLKAGKKGIVKYYDLVINYEK